MSESKNSMEGNPRPLLLRFAQSIVNAVHAIVMFLRPEELEGSPAFHEGYAGREPNLYKQGTQQHADWEAGRCKAIESRAW